MKTVRDRNSEPGLPVFIPVCILVKIKLQNPWTLRTCTACCPHAVENVKTRGLASSSERVQRNEIYSSFFTLNPFSWKKFHLNCVFDFQRNCSLYFCTKNTRKSIDIGLRKQALASRIKTFLFGVSSFSREAKRFKGQERAKSTCSTLSFFKNCSNLSSNISNRWFYFSL